MIFLGIIIVFILIVLAIRFGIFKKLSNVSGSNFSFLGVFGKGTVSLFKEITPKRFIIFLIALFFLDAIVFEKSMTRHFIGKVFSDGYVEKVKLDPVKSHQMKIGEKVDVFFNPAVLSSKEGGERKIFRVRPGTYRFTLPEGDVSFDGQCVPRFTEYRCGGIYLDTDSRVWYPGDKLKFENPEDVFVRINSREKTGGGKITKIRIERIG